MEYNAHVKNIGLFFISNYILKNFMYLLNYIDFFLFGYKKKLLLYFFINCHYLLYLDIV